MGLPNIYLSADRTSPAFIEPHGVGDAAGEIEYAQPAALGRQSANEFYDFHRLHGSQHARYRPDNRSI